MNELSGLDPVLAAQLLPESARQLAALIGLPHTLKLVERLGGTTFPVSKNKTPAGIARFEVLADVVGEDHAHQLCRHFGGFPLYIPACAEALRALRDQTINTRFESLVRTGTSANAAVAELARAHRLSDRRVWDILKKPELVPNAQVELFRF